MQSTATEQKLKSSDVDYISGVLAGKVPDNINSHSIREEQLSKYEIDNLNSKSICEI